MGTSTPYPNGQVLVSNALVPSAINVALQNLTCGAIGINPPDPKKVRIEWPPQGQPFQDATQDICYINAIFDPSDPYSKIRDLEYSESVQNGETILTENYGITRVWKITWHLYGPNATDRARALWSAMFIEYFTNQLAQVNLFPVSEISEPIRLPQEINAQWWDYSWLEVNMYEAITETINDGIATSVEVTVQDGSKEVADITVQST